MGKRKGSTKERTGVKVRHQSNKKKVKTDSFGGVKKRIKGDPVKKSLKNVEAAKKVLEHVSGHEGNTNKPTAKMQNGESDEVASIRHILFRRQEKSTVPEEKLIKYSRGPGVSEKALRNRKVKHREEEIGFAIEQAAKTELLLLEDSGHLEADKGESTLQYTQKQICHNVDITSATKHFELKLEEFGPYRVDYTRNGRHLLIGGRRGHVASIDWTSKKLFCEINVMEEVFDVQWLHNETMFAVAQKKWTYIYDKAGVELHCLKALDNVLRMDFLPYHFLLVTCSDRSFVSWLDVSIGKIVAQFPTHLGRLNLLTHNPYNAVVCLGHANGTVSMWSPNVKEPLAKMLCHHKPLQGIAVDPSGKYMATSALDRSVKIWDIRMLNGPLQDYLLRSVATNLDFSQRNMLALSLGNIVEIYRDCCTKSVNKPYLRHYMHRNVVDLGFCPYEDVLGVGSETGFTSLLVPGAGEPNFDALEWNPYQSLTQRREKEVKALLEKVQPEFITLDPNVITQVDVPTLQQRMKAQEELMLLKPRDFDFTPRPRKGRRSGTARANHAKQIVKDLVRREFVKNVKEARSGVEEDKPKPPAPTSVLDRFLPKKRT